MTETINTDLKNEALALAARKSALARTHGDDANGLDCLVDGTTVQKLAPTYPLSSPLADAGLGAVQYKHKTVQGVTSSSFGGEAIMGPFPAPTFVYGYSLALWLIDPIGLAGTSSTGGLVCFYLWDNPAISNVDNNHFPYLALAILGSGKPQSTGYPDPYQGAVPTVAKTVWFPRGLGFDYDFAGEDVYINMRYMMGFLGYRFTLYYS